jgi:adhesin transport system outer membrane protein
MNRSFLFLTAGIACCLALSTSVQAATDIPAGLPAALRSMLLNHPSLAGKQAQVRAKESAADAARAARYPTLSASAGTGQNAGYSGTSTATLSARQPLWAFGRIDNAIAYADQDIQVQQADAWSTRRQLLEETAVSYSNVQGARERLAVAEQSVLRHQELQQQIQRRAAGGLASTVDVSMAQTRLLQARAQRESTEADLRNAEAALLALTQLPVASDLPAPSLMVDLPGESMIGEQVLAQSAVLRLREAMVALAAADVQRERTATMPTVLLEAGRNQVARLPNQTSSTTINIVMQANLEGMGLANQAQQRAALERVESARQDLAQQRHEQQIQLRQLLDRRASDQTLLAGYAESVMTLESTLASFRRQYESGYKSWLDVLNAVRELADQQMQQTQVQASWRVNSLRLSARMGRLDEPGTPAAMPLQPR